MCLDNLKYNLLVALLLLSLRISAQQILTAPDSLPFTKPKPLKSMYKVNHSVLGEISIVNREPKLVNSIPKNFWGDVAEGTIILLSGLSASSSEESTWVMDNELASANTSNSWNVPLFFAGEFVKDRERVRNEDGSVSVETRKGVFVDWTKGAYGLILNNGDTLGGFSVLTNPETDSFNMYWLSRVIDESSNVRAKLKKYHPEPPNYDFQVSGVFRGQSFLMVTSGNDFRSVVLIDDTPQAIFQSDPDFIILGKKDRISPYILFAQHTDDEERVDLIRLALLNSLIARCVGQDFYNK